MDLYIYLIKLQPQVLKAASYFIVNQKDTLNLNFA